MQNLGRCRFRRTCDSTLQSTARGPERDGDLDNTVVGHEWGHYLHHRLANCGNSQQCAGMSEGWGDFNALMLLLREGDNRDGVYAMAPYAIAATLRSAPATSLRAFDAGVCILQDQQSPARSVGRTSLRHLQLGLAARGSRRVGLGVLLGAAAANRYGERRSPLAISCRCSPARGAVSCGAIVLPRWCLI